MNDNLKMTFVDRAREALAEDDSEQREHIYNDLIEQMEQVFGKNNDKEVAAELQRIAKTIEESGDPDSAFAFKQRSCEIMLKRNMAARRARGPAGGAQGLDRSTLTGLKPLNRLLQTLECVCMPSQDAERDADFYRRNTFADQVFQHNSPKMIGLKVSSGPVLLLMELPELETCQPVYSADDPTKVLAELARHEIHPLLGPIATQVGTIYGFKDPSGNRFALIDKKKKG